MRLNEKSRRGAGLRFSSELILAGVSREETLVLDLRVISHKRIFEVRWFRLGWHLVQIGSAIQEPERLSRIVADSCNAADKLRPWKSYLAELCGAPVRCEICAARTRPGNFSEVERVRFAPAIASNCASACVCSFALRAHEQSGGM